VRSLIVVAVPLLSIVLIFGLAYIFQRRSLINRVGPTAAKGALQRSLIAYTSLSVVLVVLLSLFVWTPGWRANAAFVRITQAPMLISAAAVGIGLVLLTCLSAYSHQRPGPTLFHLGILRAFKARTYLILQWALLALGLVHLGVWAVNQVGRVFDPFNRDFGQGLLYLELAAFFRLSALFNAAFTENGLVLLGSLVPWERIETYDFEGSPESVLRIQIRPRRWWPFATRLSFEVGQDQQRQLNEFLREHVVSNR
jgi:hypothetical protein